MNTQPLSQTLTLVSARVRDAYLRQPFYVDAGDDLVSVCRALAARGLTCALVRDGARLGLFTTTDLRDALLLPQPPAQVAVGSVARFELIEIQADRDLFEALWTMVQRRVHRLVVRDGAAVVGVLGQLDLVSFVANHPHIVALQTDEACSAAQLADAARRVDAIVQQLHAAGMRIERIAHLVTVLNRRLFARAWALVAPAELAAQACLLVMGSEGRGEQILKTDQDNALILPDAYAGPDPQTAAQAFRTVLEDLGYPACPGDVMVTNPEWRQPLDGLRHALAQWLLGEGADGPLKLAIFFDATVVAGPAALLAQARDHLDRLVQGRDTYLARFAAPADQFDEPGHWWTRLTTARDEQALDLKKLGTFPIVHGVRALALQHGVRAEGTAERLQQLVAAGALDAARARDLVDALHLLMGVRLTHQLRERERGAPPGNEVRASELGTLEREPLRHALAIARGWRQWLREHFRLEAL